MTEMNLGEIEMKEALEIIETQIANDDYDPAVLIGKSGIGKTESIMGLAQKLGIQCVVISLGLYTETDLVGLPFHEFDNDYGGEVTKHAISAELPPQNSTEKGILFIDEITSSTRDMRTAIYGLMDSKRRLNNYFLPPKWKIIAAGNGENDGGDFRGCEPALFNRGCAWRVEPSFEQWKEWAVKHNVNPSVIAYLSLEPQKLHELIMDDNSGVFPSPRSWTKLAKNLDQWEFMGSSDKKTRKMIQRDSIVIALANATVGSVAAPRFASFYKYNSTAIRPHDIIEGKVTDPHCLSGASSETLCLTAENLTSVLKSHVDRARQSHSKTEMDKCFVELANAMTWYCIMDEAGELTMDILITVLRDLNKALDGFMSEVLITRAAEFDKICPKFDEMTARHSTIVAALNSSNPNNPEK